jgi:O-antigen/teichoic acid export membrane protein
VTLRTLSNAFLQAATVVYAPLAPEMVRFQTRAEHEKLVSAFSALWISLGTLVNTGLLVLMPFAGPIFTYWTRGKLSFDAPLFALLAVGVALRTLGMPVSSQIGAMNKLRALSSMALLHTAVVLLLSVALAPAMGLRAFGVAVVAGEFVGSVCVPFYCMDRDLPAHVRSMWRKAAAIAALQVLVVAAVAVVAASGPMLPAPLALPAIAIGIAIIGVSALRQWSALPREIRFRVLAALPGTRRFLGN